MGLRQIGCPSCGAAGIGQFVGIEVKSRGGSLSELQRNFGEQIAIRGGLFVVAHSLEEACEALGIPPPPPQRPARSR